LATSQLVEQPDICCKDAAETACFEDVVHPFGHLIVAFQVLPACVYVQFAQFDKPN